MGRPKRGPPQQCEVAVRGDELAAKSDELAVENDELAVRSGELAVRSDELAVRSGELAVKLMSWHNPRGMEESQGDVEHQK